MDYHVNFTVDANYVYPYFRYLIFETPISLQLKIRNEAGELLDDQYALENAYFELGGDEYSLDNDVLLKAIDKLYKDKPYYQLVIDACTS